jgi:hypothetical protein
MGWKGRDIAHAVTSWVPTAAVPVRARVWSCGTCGAQSDIEAGFLRVLSFPLPIFIPPTAPQEPLSIIWGWYNRAIVAAVPSGLSLTLLRINGVEKGRFFALANENKISRIAKLLMERIFKENVL